MALSTHIKGSPTAPRISDEALRPFVGYSIKRAMNVIRADLRDVLDPMDLRMITFSALTLIGDNPALSQAQLAAALSVERPNLVAVIDELAGRGLISREKVPTDRRTYALRLTTQGARLLARATEAVQAHEDKLLEGLDPDDLATLRRVLADIERNGTERS